MVFFLRRFVQVDIYGGVFFGNISGIKTVIMNFTQSIETETGSAGEQSVKG